MPDFRSEIQEILDLLSRHLGRYIQDTLEPLIGRSDWTVVLQEMDRARGRSPKSYSETDLQAQLRVMSEHLGALGKPFRKRYSYRQGAPLTGELSLVKMYFDHGDPFTAIDVFRTADTVVRILEEVGFIEGSREATKLRSRAQRLLTSQQDQLEQQEPPLAGNMREARDTDVVVHEDVKHRVEAEKTPIIGDERLPFEPWQVVDSGPQETLDDLRRKVAKDKVRLVIEDIVDREGPVSLERLAKLVLASFNFTRLYERRLKQVKGQVTALGFPIDNDQFVWPTDMDRNAWYEYRPSTGEFTRPLNDVSPVEIANAMIDIATSQGPLPRAELDKQVLAAFGKKRRSKDHLAILERGYSNAKHRRLVSRGDLVTIE